LNAWYQRRDRDTEFNERLDERPPGVPGAGYAGFIRERETISDEVGTRLVLRPNVWFKTTLAYRLVATDYKANTDAAGLTTGGEIDSGSYDSSIYSINFTLTPWQRLRLFSSFSLMDTRSTTAHNKVAAIVPYDGQAYSVLANAIYALSAKTDLRLSYDFSWADYAQNNEAAGLPLGIKYQRHGLRAGISRELSKWLRTSLEYVWYRYDEPSSGHFNDYTAQGVFAMANVRWQ
jgi:hypothetical protein